MAGRKNILLRNRIKAVRGQVVLSLLLILRLLLASTFGRRLYWQLLRKLVKKTGLFDAEYYLSANEDVASQNRSALRHYVAYGDKEGRLPLPVFEPAYYRQHCRRTLATVNSLLHYVYVGRYYFISPSPWFDVNYYLARNKDIARSGMDPLRHYLSFGGLEGRSPCPYFDSAFYLRENPDAFVARSNPLLHYIRFGRFEGRLPHPDAGVAANGESFLSDLESTLLPSDADWRSVKCYAQVEDAAVDVIVPVYKGRIETLRCIYSLLLSTNQTKFELIVIDDCSPEENLADDLESLAKRGFFTLLKNSENLGFVRTINRGLQINPQRDVVLLNSDTEVYGNWLDRMRAVANSREVIGTVTPLSNNATICSYPRFLYDNPYPLEIDYAALDRLTARVNAGFYVESPTAVGFCMYVKRDCLDEVGLFDEETFGKGYGEENDFCQRAIASSWCNVITAEVFVRHWGATSFQGDKEERVQNVLKVLGRMYPDYHKDIQQFIVHDPLALARKRLDCERLQRFKQVENVLIISHNRGGGSERHVQEDVARLLSQGKGVYFLRPQQGIDGRVVVKHPVVKLTPNMPSLQLADTQALVQTLKDLSISEIHTHGLVDFPVQAPEYLVRAVKKRDLYFEVSLHDYKVVCPRINLVDGQGYYCGEPAARQCNICLKTNGSDFSVRSIESWRKIHYRALLAADRVLVPDPDVAQRIKKYYPDLDCEVSPHEDIDKRQMEWKTPVLQAGETLRIVIIGAIGKIKGFDVLLACARDARERGLPFEFILMGYSMHDRLLRDAGVEITGQYRDEMALETLKELDAHLVWLPSLWPETYSYTLSIALRSQKQVVAFDIGAIARRIREVDENSANWLIPLEFAKNTQAVNNHFLKFFPS